MRRFPPIEPVFVVFVVFVLLIPARLPGQRIFLDRFDHQAEGSDGAPAWRPTKGEWVIMGGHYLQRSLDYDCGSLADVFLEGSFRFGYRFRINAGEAGAGFFFSSESKESTAFAHMVRFDGPSRMLFGYFENGEFQAQKTVLTHLDPGRWHRLQLTVDGEQQTYSVALDERKVGEGVSLRYPAGYAGLQSSGCETSFDDVEIIKISDKEGPCPLSWPVNFTLDRSDRVWIPDRFHNRVYILDHQGSILRWFGGGTQQNGIFHRIGTLLLSPNGDVLITDVGINRLLLFDSAGRWKNSIGSVGQFSDLADLIFFPEEHWIGVLESLDPQITFLDSNFQMLFSGGRNHLNRPIAADGDDHSLAVLDAGDHFLKLFDLEDHRLIFRKGLQLPPGIAKDVARVRDHFFVIVNKEVFKLSAQGDPIALFHGEMLTNFTPSSLMFSPAGELWLADFTGNRLIRLTEELFDPKLRLSFPDRHKGVITWETTFPQKSALEVTSERGKMFLFHEKRRVKKHRFYLDHLHPASIYYLRPKMPFLTVPRDTGWAKRLTMMTPPPEGRKGVVHFPALCILFTRVVADDDSLADRTPGLSDDEVKRIRQQIQNGALFYWVHSHFNFWVDVDFLRIDKKFRLSQLVGREWYSPPRETVIDSLLRSTGRGGTHYPALFYLLGLQRYLADENRWELAGRGGGFTNGISANQRFGISWWYVTHANHSAGNNWLMVHEFNHQVDDLFNTRGYPEYWFNHFAPKLANVGPFGEHFDGNSYLIHLIPDAWWFDLKRGEILFVDDRDEDGIPDRDARLPLDEARLGSSPVKTDSDGDGVDDLKEITFGNWIIEGQGETYGGKALFPDLTNKDSDGDGVPDGSDRHPLYPMKEDIPYGTPAIDGVIAPREWNSLFHFEDKRIQARIGVCWDSTALYWVLELDKNLPFKIQIDGHDDGWFLGAENYLLKFTPDSSGIGLKTQLFDASDFRKWPRMNPDAAHKLPVFYRYRKARSGLVIEVAIRKLNRTGLRLQAGKGFGFNIGFLCPMDAFHHRRYVVIFEPNRFMHAKLVQ